MEKVSVLLSVHLSDKHASMCCIKNYVDRWFHLLRLFYLRQKSFETVKLESYSMLFEVAWQYLERDDP